MDPLGRRNNYTHSIPAEVQNLPYFYPNFTNSKTATQYLDEHAEGPGYFLLRCSSKGDNYLSLSVSISNKAVRHVNVVIESQTEPCYYIVPEVKFNSFDDLIAYYSQHRICNVEQIENVRLIHPVFKYTKQISNGRNESKTHVSGKQNMISFSDVTPNLIKDPFPGLQNWVPDRQRKDSASRPLPEVPVSDPGTRPPCPTPPSLEGNTYYTKPIDQDRNRLAQLQQVLRDTELCHCGILFKDSDLPEGWTLHRSHEAETCGSIFYQSQLGETTWTLPEHLIPQLSSRQKNIITKLCHMKGLPTPMNMQGSRWNETGSQHSIETDPVQGLDINQPVDLLERRVSATKVRPNIVLPKVANEDVKSRVLSNSGYPVPSIRRKKSNTELVKL